jgi:hypothetical protein
MVDEANETSDGDLHTVELVMRLGDSTSDRVEGGDGDDE